MRATRRAWRPLATVLVILLVMGAGSVGADPEDGANPKDGGEPKVGAVPNAGLESIAHELRKVHAALQVIDIAIWLAVAVAAAATLSAYAAVVLPHFTRRARTRREESPRLALVLGTINGLGLAVLCGLLDGNGSTKGAAVVGFIALAFLLFAGAHVSAGAIGRRVLDDLDRPASGFVDHGFGMGLLAVQALLPIVGWAYFAYQIAVGVGATILAVARRGTRGGADTDPRADAPVE